MALPMAPPPMITTRPKAMSHSCCADRSSRAAMADSDRGEGPCYVGCGRLPLWAKRWQRRPEGSNWGEFGPDDERGRLNLLTPAKVRQGLAEAREGIAFCLSLPLDLPGGNRLNPRRHPPRLMAARREAGATTTTR